MALIPTKKYLEALDDVLSKRYDKSEYSFYGYKECAVCILYRDGKWFVFNGEKGNHYNEDIYDTILEACIGVIRKMTNIIDDIASIENEFIDGILHREDNER